MKLSLAFFVFALGALMAVSGMGNQNAPDAKPSSETFGTP